MTAVIKVRILPSAVGVHFALEGTGKKAVAPHKYVCLAGSEHPLNKQTRNRQEEVLMSPPFQPSPPILYNHVDIGPTETSIQHPRHGTASRQCSIRGHHSQSEGLHSRSIR